MTPLRDILEEINRALLARITPASAQRDIEEILALQPSDPEYEVYYGVREW